MDNAGYTEPDTDFGHGLALIAGDCGTGKSTFAAAAPNHFIFDFDHGLRFLRHRGRRFAIDEWDEFAALVQDMAAQDPFPYSVIIIDTLDSMVECAERKVMGQSTAKLTWDDRDKLYTKYKRAFRAIESMPAMKIFLVHTKTKDVNGVARAVNVLPSGLNYYTQKAADVHGYCRTIVTAKGITHQIHFRESPEWEAKDRTRRLPPVLPLDYQSFMEHLKNGSV